MEKNRVRIRRGRWKVKPEAEQVDGNIYLFAEGWLIEKEGSSMYAGETAMIPCDDQYPIAAPAWLPTGDLELCC